MAIRECTEQLNEDKSALAWAQHEIDRLRGKRPGKPKYPLEEDHLL